MFFPLQMVFSAEKIQMGILTEKKIICSEIHYEQNIIKFENYPIMINIVVCLL